MSEVILLVGLPGCGKSSYASKKAKEGWIVINDDALVTMFHGGHYTKYDPLLKSFYLSAEINLFLNAINNNLNVIIDRPNLTKASRAKYLSLCTSLMVPVTCVLFNNFDKKKLLNNRMKNGGRNISKKRWKEVIDNMWQVYEEPIEDEGIDIIEVIK